jgi:hypothetical protein
MLAEQAVFFARLRGHGGGDFDELPVALEWHRRAADEREFDVDVRNEMCGQLAVHAIGCFRVLDSILCHYDARRTDFGKPFLRAIAGFGKKKPDTASGVRIK